MILVLTSGGYYFNESKKRCGSFNAKHHDEIITKLNLQAREEYERTKQYSQKQKIQDEEGLSSQKRGEEYS
jgi:hypothetical protein